jgi:RNA polymerase sigma-70 factor (ECF subfamily)
MTPYTDTHDSGPLSEAERVALIARVRAGDQEALGRLYRDARPAVMRYLARRMDVCRDDLEDVVQETFLRAPAMAAEFKPDTHEVGAWLCGRVAHWTLADRYRKQRFAQHSARDAGIDAALRGPVESAHSRETRPVSPRIVQALARLTPAQRRAVQLRYLDGYSNETAAEVAGSTPKALASNALDARKRLCKELADVAPRPVSWVATLPQAMAVRAALAGTGNDMPAALAWLRERGVTVNDSYAYKIRKGEREPRQGSAKGTAVREVLAELGACDAASAQARLRERGIEVTKSYINTVRRRDTDAPLPPSKNTLVRAALAELDTTGAATVQANLRERGIEISKSYINQVRRTPAAVPPTTSTTTVAAQLEAAASLRAVPTSTAQRHEDIAGAVADKAGKAVARARAALGRIPAPRASAAAEEPCARSERSRPRERADWAERAGSYFEEPVGVSA